MTTQSLDPLLDPIQLGALRLRNRMVSTSHEPAYAEDGLPKGRYRRYHEEKARGGVGLTMIGGSAVVAQDSPSTFGNMHLYKDEIVPWMAELAESVHEQGAGVLCQVTHLGQRTSHRTPPRTADRMRLAATAAVATGALIGTATQLAHAAPLLPGNHTDEAEPVAQKSAPEPELEVAQAAAPAPVQAAETPAAPQAQPIAAPEPAPFGLKNLPPEVSGPLSQAEDVLKDIQQQFAPAQAVRPVGGVVSSGFGSRWGTVHHGIDFADPIGTPIHSVESGTVIEAGPASGFGQWVRVKQPDGTTAVYGHVNQILVSEGQRVNAGDVIATVGNRGNSTGSHLHLEIWNPNDVKINPAPYLASKGVVLSQQGWGAGQ